MKRFLFSAAVVMGAMGIFVANYSNAGSNLPISNKNYIVKDTVPSDTTNPMPSDTTQPRDSTFLLK